MAILEKIGIRNEHTQHKIGVALAEDEMQEASRDGSDML